MVRGLNLNNVRLEISAGCADLPRQAAWRGCSLCLEPRWGHSVLAQQGGRCCRGQCRWGGCCGRTGGVQFVFLQQGLLHLVTFR